MPLPGQDKNAIQHAWPGIGCWFWTAQEFAPEGYKTFVDLYAKHSGLTLLTTSLRHPVELTDPAVHQQIKDAAEYARSRGLSLALDLDVRLARAAFQQRHPEQMQELMRLREFPVAAAGNVEMRIASPDLGDHYTYRAPSYHALSSRFLRAYSYTVTEGLIDRGSLQDVTERCLVIEQSPHKTQLMLQATPEEVGRKICVMAAFTLFTPDAFAPDLCNFEAALIEQYGDVPLAGVCKDEWGFPGRFDPSLDDLWYSEHLARAYQEAYGGGDMLAEMFLMWRAQQGREAERNRAINQYMALCLARHVEVETRFVAAGKRVFGAESYVGTHPTWYPIPGREDALKNGLHWWQTPRDLAQTDEGTPYAVRTALTKKWHSPLWFNMYYDASLEVYEADLWRHALGGGRMNYHPLYPASDASLNTSLLHSRLLQADARIRLLNYISTAPVDCPVLVLFGHAATLNWAEAGFGDVGLNLTDALWEQGFYADLAPTSELSALRVAESGRIAYGPQEYRAAVLYQPEFETPDMAEFFYAAAQSGKTALFRVGAWQQDFRGKRFEGARALPPTMRAGDVETVVQEIVTLLEAAGVERQTRCTPRGTSSFPQTMTPLASGHLRLLDGTHILASGEKDVMGDLIQQSLTVSGVTLEIEAVGIAAFRMDAAGTLEAFAAGGLKTFNTPSLQIALEQPVDVALWRGDDGNWRGVIHGDAALPQTLLDLTQDWTRVALPAPFSGD